MRSGLKMIGLAGFGLLLCSAGPARADAIDGDWCSGDGRQITIQGPSIVTPGGTRMQGSYTRHTFDYTIPANEPQAGEPVEMRLLGETRVQVHIGPAERAPAIWHRCTGTTS